ncbi:MAG: hypothetical protein M3O06_12430, partial [Pseudomonadota bacterium]|nr:hypothetical protein [Pseudomonadota bacterium]
TLRTEGYDPRQRVADGEVWAGVWVYVPVPAAAAGDAQVLAKLKAAGIGDALEMPGPADAPVISLGVFSDLKRAREQIARAKSAGLTPATADRRRTGQVYWIDMDLAPTAGSLDPADLQSESGRISRLEIKPCPAQAKR